MASSTMSTGRGGDHDDLRGDRHAEEQDGGEAVDVEEGDRSEEDLAAFGSPREPARACRLLATRLRWVRTAAFGVPVVPPVYCRRAGSEGLRSAPGGVGGRSARGRRRGSRRSRRAPHPLTASAWVRCTRVRAYQGRVSATSPRSPAGPWWRRGSPAGGGRTGRAGPGSRSRSPRAAPSSRGHVEGFVLTGSPPAAGCRRRPPRTRGSWAA